MGGAGFGVGVAGWGVCLCSGMGWVMKGVVLLKVRPLSLGFPLWVVLLLEGTNWEVSQEELDLWWSQAGADH